MFKDCFFRCLMNAVLVVFVLASSAYADGVEVTDPENSNGEVFVVGVMEEGGKFYHDRDYTMTGIPEQYLGCTSIMTSADTQGSVDFEWTFEIDRPAFVCIAFDGRHSHPEDRDQDPKDWFSDEFVDTGEILFLDAPHAPTEYWIYKSNDPYPKGEVILPGIAPSENSNQTLWVMFLEEGKLAVLSPSGKLAVRWGEIKSSK